MMNSTKENTVVRSRRAIYISFALILLYWAVLTAQQLLLRPIPSSIPELLLRKSLEAGITFFAVWLLLRKSNQTLTDLGFRLDGFRGILIYGVLLPVGLFLITNVVLNSFLSALTNAGTASAVRALFRDPREAPYWILTAIIGGGFAEELQRAFVLTRFEQLFGRRGLAVAVVVDSVVFGLRHLYQGGTGAISAGFTGLIFALIFLRRRQVVDAMVSHAGYDLLGIVVAYALYGSRV